MHVLVIIVNMDNMHGEKLKKVCVCVCVCVCGHLDQDLPYLVDLYIIYRQYS